jgi:hypothetical protein
MFDLENSAELVDWEPERTTFRVFVASEGLRLTKESCSPDRLRDLAKMTGRRR